MTRDEEETGQHRRKWSNGPHTTQQPLFSKLRSFNHLALSSVGSFFSGISTSKASYEGDDSIEHGSSVGCTAGHELDLDHDFNMAPQPTVSGSTDQPLEDSENDLTPHVSDCYILQREDYWNHQSPGDTVESLNEIHYGTRKSPRKAHISTFLPETRRFFGGLSRTRCVFDQNGCYDSDFASNSSVEPAMGSAPLSSTAVFPSSMASLDGSLFSTPSESRFVSHAHGHSGDLETPPLTPDLANNHVLPSIVPVGAFLKPSLTSGSSRFSSRFTLSDTSEEIPDNTEDGAIYTSPYLREIKEGKKPERVSVADEDIECDPESDALGAAEGPDEWYGLEYTLEMSSRERQPSESQSRSFSGGEHSRSRESWAAIHRGTIHPFFEDEDYRQWKNWHHYLDRQAEKKRHKKGYEFKSRSKQLAWLYVDEIRTRDVLYWQKEVFGAVARDVKDRLQYIVERRPDPFFPPQKHDWSWYLKRSRSVACLRELKIILH